MSVSLNIEGRKITKEGDIMEALNHHFAAVGPKLSRKIEQNATKDNPLKPIDHEPSKMRLTPVDNPVEIFINI